MPSIDFAIVTALSDEFESLKQLFPPFQEISDGVDVWYRTRVQSESGTSYEIVAAFQGGTGAAALVLGRLQVTVAGVSRV